MRVKAGTADVNVEKSPGNSLVAKSADYVEHERKHDAQQNRCCKREVKSRVLASIDDVSRQAADRQVRAAEKNENQARYHQDQP